MKLSKYNLLVQSVFLKVRLVMYCTIYGILRKNRDSNTRYVL